MILNHALTSWWKRWKKATKATTKQKLRRELKRIWDDAENKDIGHWDKVLKRFYSCVAVTGDSWLDKFVLTHLISYPELYERIFESFAKRGEAKKLVHLFRDFVDEGECMYEATEAHYFDALLLADASPKREKLYLNLVRDFISGKMGKTSGRPLGMASAVLCYYWFGGEVDELPKLSQITRWAGVPEAVIRAIISVNAARRPSSFAEMLPYLVGHPGDDVGRLVQFTDGVMKGRVDYIIKFAHPKRRWPLPGMHYDARAWLCFEILAHAPNVKLRRWLQNEYKAFAKFVATRQEQRVATRIKRLLK